MVKTIVAVALLATCLAGCQSPEANKAAGMTVLNVNDLNDEYAKNKEGLRAKYDGKEVVVIGRAISGFNPESFFGADMQRLTLSADSSRPAGIGVICEVKQADAATFGKIPGDATVTVKGVLHVENMRMSPCTRDFRGEK
jgi:hypothetical protein